MVRSALFAVVASLTVLATTTSCSDAGVEPHPAPILEHLSPDGIVVGSPATSITLQGRGFSTASHTQWNGADRVTTFVSETQLDVTLLDADLLTPGIAHLSVTNPPPGGGTSAALEFTVGYPIPAIGSVSPGTAFIDDAGVTLAIDGTGFTPASIVQWNDQPLATNFVSPTRVLATVSAPSLAQPGTAVVDVWTPPPGGGKSATTSVAILIPTPVVASIDPQSVLLGVPFVLTFTGSHFFANSQVQWNGVARLATFVNSSTLRVDVPAADVAAPGAISVSVMNPGPGGGAAQPASLIVRVPPPQLAAMAPTTAVAGGPSFTLVVSGSYFSSGMSVLWNGQPRTTTFVSANTLAAAIPAQDIASSGTATVAVRNPANGEASGGLPFTISLPLAPQLSSISPASAAAGGANVSLTVQGANFTSGMVVQWNGQPRTTAFVSPSTFTAFISGQDLSVAGTAVVTVRNLTTGQVSNAATFTVTQPPAPQLDPSTPLSPSSVAAGTSGLTLTVNGSNFRQGMVFQWNGAPRTTVNITSVSMQAAIGASDLASGGTASITVRDPNTGQVSNAATFTIVAAPPPPPLTQTSVQLSGDAGDYIIGPTTYTYTKANATIGVNASGGHLSVSIAGDQDWNGDFQLPSGMTQFATGTYSGLTRYPFNGASGGLSWYGEGRGCNTLTGSFTVDAVTYTSGTLTSIDLRFEQHCEGFTAAARGTIRYRANDLTQPPGPVLPIPSSLWRPPTGATPPAGNYVYLQSDAGEYVVGGKTVVYKTGSDAIGVTASGGHVVVLVGGYYGDFQTMNVLTRMQTGYYPGLERYPFNNPVKGGLDWFGNGVGCNEVSGWFVVDNVTYSGTTMTSLDLRFEHRCDGQAPLLHGAIHWQM